MMPHPALLVGLAILLFVLAADIALDATYMLDRLFSATP